MNTLDIFPARVKIGEQQWRSARVHVTPEGMGVVLVAPQGVVEVVARGNVAGLHRDRLTPKVYRLDAEGGTWEITRGGGCGCGSPLRRFDVSTVLA